jgi:hypothetical protein
MKIPLLQFKRASITQSRGRIPRMTGYRCGTGGMTDRKMVPQRGPKGTLISKLTLCATDKKQIQEY